MEALTESSISVLNLRNHVDDHSNRTENDAELIDEISAKHGRGKTYEEHATYFSYGEFIQDLEYWEIDGSKCSSKNKRNTKIAKNNFTNVHYVAK